MLSLAALLSKGAPLPFADEDESGEPMTVIYQTTEDDADDTVVPRFNSAGGDGDRLIFIKEDEKEPDDPRRPLLSVRYLLRGLPPRCRNLPAICTAQP